MNEEPITIVHQEKRLKVEQIICLLHSYCRFFIIEDAYEIDLEQSSKLSRHLETDKKSVKKWIDISKNTAKNRIYRKSRLSKVLADKSCFLKINDKKEKETSEDASTYEYIDVLRTNMLKEDI